MMVVCRLIGVSEDDVDQLPLVESFHPVGPHCPTVVGHPSNRFAVGVSPGDGQKPVKNAVGRVFGSGD
jgi:hypothetical protein